MYRTDVMAVIDGQASDPDSQASAVIVVICPSSQVRDYRQIFSELGEFAVEIFEDVLAALVAVGGMAFLAAALALKVIDRRTIDQLRRRPA